MTKISFHLILKFLLILFICSISSTHAQMATASLFSGMKSVNPAVIGSRLLGQITGIGKIDKIKKNQTLTADGTFPFNGTDSQEIDIISTNFFRGGNGKKGKVTSELTLDFTNGTKSETLATVDQTIQDETKVNSKFLEFGLGLGKNFGVAVKYLDYDYKQSSNFTFAGESIAVNSTVAVVNKSAKVGFKGSFGLDFGIFVEHIMQEVDIILTGTNNDDDVGAGTTKTDDQNIGLALGASSKNFHFEFGYERALEETKYEDPIEGTKTYTASRASATAELKIKKVTLGYTGRYFMDGFSETETTIVDQLVYNLSQFESRLVNTFNFSYGSTKGWSFSGSVYYSKTDVEEKNSLIFSSAKHKTEVTSQGASIQVGYVF